MPSPRVPDPPRVLVKTSDGVNVSVRTWPAGPNAPVDAPSVVFIHGWSGSAKYFDSSLRLASDAFPTAHCVDLRGHGESGKPGHGYRVSRLAADLREVLEALSALDGGAGKRKYVLVGTSMGCAVIWSHLDLFGTRDGLIDGVVLVDQAPLQNKRPGWTLGSKGCYDAETYEKLASAVRSDMSAFADGNAEACLVDPSAMDVNLAKMLKEETLKCCPEALCELMYDHTALDWRDVCRTTDVRALVLGGRQSKIFPWQGVAVVGELMKNSETVFYDDCDHWLYLEQPKRFIDDVERFILRL